jgi:N-carbamoylputrescine amidase
MTIKIALLQLACVENVAANEAKHVEYIREAAANGAQIIGLQELFNAQYFAQYVDVKSYKYAQKIPCDTTDLMSKLAAELGVVLIVPIYEEAMAGVYFNTVVVFDTDGKYLGKYRKNHIPDGPQYHEKFYFTPGDMGYPIFETKFGTNGFPKWRAFLRCKAQILSFIRLRLAPNPTAPITAVTRLGRR